MVYSIEDLLQDDYFIASILDPTDKSNLYWERLIEQGLLDKDTYDRARSIVMNPIEDRIDDDVDKKLQNIWDKIIDTNKKKKKSFTIYWSAACVAASIIGIIVLQNYLSPIVDNTISANSDYDFSKIEKVEASNNIEIVVNNTKIVLDSDEAVINHTKNGNIKINDTLIVSKQDDQIRYNQLIVPYGKRSSLKLIDGSNIIINAGTRVVYPEKFIGDKREIYVDGEVYADIAPDRTRPFIVRSSDLSVEVLGTKFNMSTYENEDNKSIVLEEGSVRIRQEKIRGKSVIIKPSQMFMLTPEGSKLSIVDVHNYTSWINGVYIFSSESFNVILARLSKYYGIKIQCPLEMNSITCSGRLDLKEDLESVLRNLSLTVSFDYSYDNGIYKFNK